MLIAALIAVGCASSTEIDDDAAAAFAESSTSTSTSTSTTTQADTTSTTETTIIPVITHDDVARVLRTSTDVIAPVVGTFEGGVLIRTPCQEVAAVTDGETIDRIQVVIDPGHGGSETGAVSPDQIAEKTVNLQTALIAEQMLQDAGVEVLLTRYTDIRMPLVTRAEIADTLDADLLISIHHQASDQFPISDETGVEVYYQQLSDESRRFAGLLVEETRSEFSAFDINWFAQQDAGAVDRPNANTGGDFYGMLRRPETTAVLAEMAYMGNEEELALMRTGELQEASARAITQAALRFLTTDDPGSGFVDSDVVLTQAGSGGGLGGCIDPDLGATLDLGDELGELLGEAESDG